MALSFGTPTSGYDATHNSNTKTFSHTCASGENYLFVMVNVQGGYGAPASTATYNGTSMSVIVTNTIQGLGDAHIIFGLENPDTGSAYNVVITGLSVVSNDLSWYAVGASDCLGSIQTPISSNGTGSPLTATFGSDITAGSALIICATGRLTLTNGNEIEAPNSPSTPATLSQGPNACPTGTLPTGEYAMAIVTGVSAGSMTVETNHNNTGGFNNSGITAIEVGDSTVGGGGGNAAAAMVGFNF